MPKPITEFNVVEFATPLEASNAAASICLFLTRGPIGAAFMLDPLRAVVKQPAPARGSGVVYFSDGAIRAAAQAGIRIPPILKRVPAAETAGAALHCGDQSDYLA